MVKIVGAGPGAKDLITVRGMHMLNEADVIIYAGSLVNEELLEYAKKDCEIYNSAYMNLDEVIDVIVKAESEVEDGADPEIVVPMFCFLHASSLAFTSMQPTGQSLAHLPQPTQRSASTAA